ncbi:rho guanine nucleotide exchange factor 7 isoform X1 [Bactrocera tryoni]|uniref:rho guanine nucleotide exchange factor 7 isoform X1 n=1 Tax=Bactrocera tryoni TaxID=59916 RepID=UPI001A968DF0|nr:rho guanine nucleotide exchange factor 7 isoform X1 [Bactrocera tryoni]XP_039952779.1 rho guanine nucleotide exchange factor 7 isoform X1 [Bactrocera tryoni]XP_039952780.1 rho guanine nucleotide exchange factor 7 isoform X1 [Bactrocera tryoni]
MSQPLIVQAEYSFKGGNNDELCFKKGDLITVTQREEGGWWEGTLNDKTGWFPSNYVNEYKAPLPLTETIRPPEEIQEYRSVVLKDLLDSERAHVAEVQGLLENFLEPLQQAQILTADEYAQLMCNFVEVVKTHDELLKQMEECNDRVGKLFLTKAPHMKLVHQAYCAAHPKAIVILDKHKDELEKYMERQGAASPGLLVLTTGLSKPFRRLDKYSAMLQELERHMESSHPDRGDTQRSVAVYKDIAAACSATRRQKELELQVLTGPVRGWQGQELSTLGDIIHMGSVAVGPDHRDRYFVLFPQTLLILSVSQRMSAFIYEGKLPLTGIIVNRLDDSDTVKNAFEINGPLIERIVAVCQGPNEANRWVELLTSANPTMPIGIKRQLSNLSNKSMSGSSSGHAPQPPPHMSPPANLGMLAAQRTNSQSSAAPTTSMGTSLSHPSQHKRSLSFNHHLSYNQYTHSQPPPPHHHLPPPQPNPQNHPVAPNHKSSLAPTSSNFSKSQYLAAVGGSTSAKIGNTRANWSITNLRPAPPLRPNLLNATTQSGSGVTSGSGSANALASYCSGRRTQPTFEEDVLVLRVFEGYCAAYQNTTRNTIHSALQPWTPCLPIRGGKLQTSKTFSTSNPQLPHLCNTGVPFPGNSGATNQQNSTNSLNSSYIWREASPNYFNLYSSSVSSLNATTTGVSGGANAGGYRYSLSGATTTNAGSGPSSLPIYERALSEERATRKSLNRMKSGFGSGYDNIFMTPLLPRKNKPSPKLVKNSYQTHQRSPPPSSTSLRNRSDSERLDLTPLTITEQEPPPQRQLQKQQRPPAPGLYDRRLNRSFETTVSHRYAGYGGGYIMSGYGPSTGYKTTPLRRSTPQLAGGEDVVDNGRDSDDVEDGPHGCSAALLRNGSSVGNCTAGDHEASTSADGDSQRHSGSWCCGNFVMKQWRKMNNY